MDAIHTITTEDHKLPELQEFTKLKIALSLWLFHIAMAAMAAMAHRNRRCIMIYHDLPMKHI